VTRTVLAADGISCRDGNIHAAVETSLQCSSCLWLSTPGSTWWFGESSDASNILSQSPARPFPADETHFTPISD